ncbi:MAG: hypothetical protein KGH72_03620 [Candidatus Micrarchaeota archaeon]|nr:hypothetical protein [Candidatus Micrarchaeota archaeon]
MQLMSPRREAVLVARYGTENVLRAVVSYEQRMIPERATPYTRVGELVGISRERARDLDLSALEVLRSEPVHIRREFIAHLQRTGGDDLAAREHYYFRRLMDDAFAAFRNGDTSFGRGAVNNRFLSAREKVLLEQLGLDGRKGR